MQAAAVAAVAERADVSHTDAVEAGRDAQSVLVLERLWRRHPGGSCDGDRGQI